MSLWERHTWTSTLSSFLSWASYFNSAWMPRNSNAMCFAIFIFSNFPLLHENDDWLIVINLLSEFEVCYLNLRRH